MVRSVAEIPRQLVWKLATPPPSRITPRGDLLDLDAAVLPPNVDARIDLDSAIETLPPGARAVLVLHDVEGYQHADIAELIGIAVGTSKAQLFRARRLLRERLDR